MEERTMSRIACIGLTLAMVSCAFLTVPGGVAALTSGDYDYELINSGTAVQISGYHGTGGAVTIPDVIDGLPVLSIGQMAFGNKASLTSVSIPHNVTSIAGWAFVSCSSLTSVTLPGAQTIGESAFAYCPTLVSVALPNCVNYVGTGAFFGDSSLSSMSMPANLTYVGNIAFTGTALTIVSLSAYVDYIGDSAFSIPTLTAIDVNAANAHYKSVDGLLYDKTVTTLIQCPCARTGVVALPGTVTTIVAYAFNDCSSITSVSIPNTVTSIGMDAFRYCHALTSITIPTGVTTISDSTFNYCTSLTSMTIPDNVQTMEYLAFGMCYGLTTVTIGNGVTTVGSYAFQQCTALASVTVGSSVTTIQDGAFQDCSSLTSITFLGLVAPTTGTDWIAGTNSAIRGYAYPESNFPSPGGDFNGLIMGTMGGGVPSAPTSLYAIAGNARVDLTWGAPLSEGGQAISWYNLYRATEEGGTYEFLTSPTGTCYEDTSVINGHTYWYEASAVNPSGEGPKAGPVNSTPSPLPPTGFTRYSSTKGYSILVPSGWTAQDDQTMSDTHYDTLVSGPLISTFQTNVFVMSGSDATIVDTEAYLDTQVQSMIDELENEGFGTVMTSEVQHTRISNRSAVVFAYDVLGTSVHQKVAFIIDAPHKHFWVIGCSASVDAMSELEPKFNAMIFGFTINSVSDPVVSDDTIVIVSFIVVIAAVMMIAILLVVRGKKCPRCGAWTKRGSAWCAKCGSPLGQNMVNFCGQCGSMLGAEGTCPSCGANKAAEKPKQ